MNINTIFNCVLPNKDELWISSKVLSTLDRYKQSDKRKNESGGLLMASYHINAMVLTTTGHIKKKYRDKANGGLIIKEGNKNLLVVENLTIPPKNAKCSDIFFVMQWEQHKKQAKRIWEDSDGSVIMCGNWHSHISEGKISEYDKKSFFSMATNMKDNGVNFCPVFIVRGVKNFYVYTIIYDVIVKWLENYEEKGILKSIWTSRI
jgi:hypothetical protein